MKRIRLLALTGAAVLSAGVFTPVRAQDPDDLKRAEALYISNAVRGLQPVQWVDSEVTNKSAR